MNKFLKWSKSTSKILIDSSMSLGLEERNLDLNNKLWTAQALANNTELIEDVHTAYFNAGSNLTITNTYQASIQGYQEAGYTVKEAKQLIRKAVELAHSGRNNAKNNKNKWIAGAIGPYGAYLANGSEYTGDYHVSNEELEAFHIDRINILIDAGCDALILETIPNFKELKVLINILDSKKVPVIVGCSLSDAKHLADKTPFKDVQDLLENATNVIAYGNNCTSPNIVSDSIKEIIKNYPKHKDIIVFPNSGAQYDPKIKKWLNNGISDNEFVNLTQEWLCLGAKYVGGCCCNSEVQTKLIHDKLFQKQS
ncbi:homocysteine S-methyltransferase [Apilactobacillus xinyiensis]|uniref:homocysteine S-methyltransferase n=1 Tax=Apilactobacillus xinyiensis TaxID=2841032 RepID=UPI00200CF513|nr:homocysteine S-methyltransferase [Apilactobacillus xinyiensis]MCL0329582.1 homocysteine S-methyltransferase [Apilactobacillus xinyiensis]